jgi:hypothetical protein
MTGFIDDNNCNCNEDAITHEPNNIDLISHMQHDAQIWHDLLWMSGGALELSKCQYHLIDWHFTHDSSPIIQDTGYLGIPMDLFSPHGQAPRIKQLNYCQSYKTLNTFVEPL